MFFSRVTNFAKWRKCEHFVAFLICVIILRFKKFFCFLFFFIENDFEYCLYVFKIRKLDHGENYRTLYGNIIMYIN